MAIQAAYHFPRGFLWGTATAAHQVEGNNTNNQWWAWEQVEGHIEHGHKSGLAAAHEDRGNGCQRHAGREGQASLLSSNRHPPRVR